jgi:hypothetical protein
MRSKSKKRKLARGKTKLGLPDLDHAKAAVLASLHSSESQRSYLHAIDEFIGWYCSEPRLSFNKTVVTRYRIHLEDRQLAPGTTSSGCPCRLTERLNRHRLVVHDVENAIQLCNLHHIVNPLREVEQL